METPLVSAALTRDLQEVTRLLNSGVDVNQRDEAGQTALHRASYFGHLAIVTLLIERGASIDIQDNGGFTPLLNASFYGKANVVTFLLEKGANPLIKTKEGKNALDWARHQNRSDCIAILENPERTLAMRQEEEEKKKKEREDEEQKQREKQQEIEENKSNRELVSSLSTQLQQKDQEILVLKDQLSSREDSLRNSEERILELTNEKKEAIERNDKLEKELLKEKEKFDNEIQELSKQLNSSQSTNRDQEEQLKEMMKKMETKDQMLVEKETLLTNLRDEISRCELQLETLMSEKESLKFELENVNLQKNSQDSSIVEGKGVKGELFEEVAELKRDVISRFKHQKYLELSEQFKKATNKNAGFIVKSMLKVLNYDNKTNPSTIISLEAIHSRVEHLQTLFEEKEAELMLEDSVASMQCEVDRLNLLTFLKVFEVEVKIGENSVTEGKDELISNLQETIAKLEDQLLVLKSNLIIKEQEMKRMKSIITGHERLKGIGLMTPHVRCIGVDPNPNQKFLKGIFHDRDTGDIPCFLKYASHPDTMSKLQREKENLEKILKRGAYLDARRYIVSWLLPSQFMTEESMYFLDETGDLIPPLPFPPSSPLSLQSLHSQHRISIHGLVLERGGLNLKEFLANENQMSVPIAQRIYILREIVEAVRFLHKLGIVHFDLKPENIVSFTSDHKMRWKLIDFDSSHDEKSSPPPVIGCESVKVGSNICLTEEYVCPEVLAAINGNYQSQNQSESSSLPIKSSMDIWSLGLIAFFIFTNQSFWSEYSTHPPFQSSMVTSIRQEDIQSILSRMRLFDHKEKSFLEGCLQVSPENRLSASRLLEKSLFSTGASTVAANAVKVTTGDVERILRDFYANRPSSSLSTSSSLTRDDLSGQFEGFCGWLVPKIEHILAMSHVEIESVLRNSLKKEINEMKVE